MNPLYQQLMGFSQTPQVPQAPQAAQTPQAGNSSFGNFQNPMQKMQYIMQVMTNPAAFVMQRFPDIPVEIQNNPMAILQYLQQTRGLSSQQIQQAQQMAQQIQGQGTVR